MRRWNGWGDDTIPYHLPGNAPVFLDEWVGPGTPPRDAALADVWPLCRPAACRNTA